MIALNIINNADKIVVTLNEKKTLTVGYFLFIFTHTTTREEIKFILNFSSDASLYKTRYNLFLVNTSVIFSGASGGRWIYNIYEQASAVNTDPAGLLEVERGIMFLKIEDFVYPENSESTNFKIYEG